MLGSVQAGAAVTNQFKLEINGMPPIYWSRVGEITQETILAEMSDGSMQTTGRIKPGETEADHYPHHEGERVALEAWRVACATGAPGHKRDGILYYNGADGQPVFAFMVRGILNKGRKTPELDAGSDGEGVKTTWMLSFDETVAI